MFLAIRELLHAKFRYILIGFIMVLITVLILMISGLAKGLSADNASSIQNLNADNLVIESGVEQELTKSFLPESAVRETAQAESVNEAVPLVIRMSSASVTGSEQQHDVAIFGTDLQGMLTPDVIEGTKPVDSNEVIADVSLQKEGIAIGDTIAFRGHDGEYTVTGFAENQRYSHTPVIYMSMAGEKINAVAIQTAEGERNGGLEPTYDILSKKEVLQGIPSYSQEQASLNMMIIFLFVIAAFVLAIFFYVITMQKKAQFGVLRALGSQTSYIINNLLFQVVIISIVCIAIAIGMTYGIKMLLPDDMPFVMTAGNTVQTSVLLLAVSLIGSLISLFQVVKVDPVEAIEGGA
ncbi:ABC transporter permease [Lentibacillus salicampi]|uniref:Putative hemin transport system permease protein HrtB n=1 Tax=Lentibacillus salicampi TaxID=175306 RepID=A0A4Y9AAM3_9BACI|nr:ABC transporter permease [Lentibacillus salicampi]TFJ92382.1 ABC transporter permease [Lentibacillus salicampi]